MLNPLHISEEVKQRLDKYPRLKECVEDYIARNGESCQPDVLPKLVVYVRCMRLDEPEFFGFDEEWADEFDSWGLNSRYVHVFNPLLQDNLNEYLEAILEELDWRHEDWVEKGVGGDFESFFNYNNKD